MIGRDLVRPLEDDWRETLDALARALRWPTSRDVARLGAAVAELSAAYNDPSRARAAMRDAGAARLGFSFARDVPKGAAAVRELVATGTLALGVSGTLRVLDLGAGLGAMTWGLLRALGAAGAAGVVDATWVDPDARAIELGAAIVRARPKPHAGALELRVRCVTDRVQDGVHAHLRERFDVVLAGQLLSELDVGAPDEVRLERHAALLRGLLDHRVDEHGALVLVEPALRERTRHLHRLRDALAASGATVFSPCIHAGPCPALDRPGDWCHEDLPIDLPPWLAPVARAAGLRYEGLTFTPLVLRRDGQRLVDAVAPAAGAVRLRVVSDVLRTKGKREAFVCGELAGGVSGRVRVMRLDRDAASANAAFERLRRGDVVLLQPAPELARPRVGGASGAVTVVVLPVRNSGDAESR
jgi:SAM-dependent methyltransferase